MALLQFTLLLVFLTECCGETRFIYTKEDNEEKLECKTNKWQISTKSDNKIDLNCSVQCESGKTELDEDDLKKPSFCSKDNDPQSGSVCSLSVKESGYYSCVKSLDPGFLFPFKSSPNVIRSYIIADQDSDLTIKSKRRSSSSVNVAEGGSVILNCSFSLKSKENIKPFIVYWIKTVEQSSTCIYSFDRDGFNHHCDEQNKLEKRLLNITIDQFTHDIKISEVKSSDSGQYCCALQMDTSGKQGESKVKWKVIENVTLNVVHNPTPPHSTDQPETPDIPETPTIPETTKTPKEPTESPEKQKSTGVYVWVLVPLCVLLLLMAGVAVFIRKRRFLSAGCKTVQQKRNQEEALDADCSPYAVGRGDHEYDSIKSPPTTADPDHKQPSEPLDPYSVVRLNDLYDSSASENVQHPV